MLAHVFPVDNLCQEMVVTRWLRSRPRKGDKMRQGDIPGDCFILSIQEKGFSHKPINSPLHRGQLRAFGRRVSWGGEKRLGRTMPPQNGDHWGSLTGKCVRWGGPTYHPQTWASPPKTSVGQRAMTGKCVEWGGPIDQARIVGRSSWWDAHIVQRWLFSWFLINSAIF